MTTTDSEEVEIENVVYLDSYEEELLQSGAPIFAEIKTTDGIATVVFMHSCTWNMDTKDEIERESHMPGDAIFRLSSTECELYKRRAIDTYKDAEIFLDRENNKD